MRAMSGFQSTVILTLVSLFAQGTRFLFQVLLSRTVGAEVMGLYQLVMSVMPVVMSLTAIGLTSACSQLTARYQALGNHRASVRVVRLSVGLFFLSLGLVALAALPARAFIAGQLLGDLRVQGALLLLLPCILLTGVENIHKHFFYGAGAVVEPALTEAGEQLVRTGAVLGLLWYFLPQDPGEAVTLILWGMILCEVFSACTLTLLFRRAMGPYPPGPGVERRVALTQIRRIALPVGCTALLGNLMGAWTAALIPRRLAASGLESGAALQAFGILKGMTLPLLSLPMAAIGALSLVLLPKMAQAHALGRSDLCRRRLSRALAATALWGFPTAALLSVLAPTLGLLLFREASAGDLAPLLALGILLSCFETVFTVTLNGLGKQRLTAAYALFCGAVQLGLTWWRMGAAGLCGYAEALALSALLGMLLNGWTVLRTLKLKPDWFSWLIGPALAAILAALCVNLLLPMLGTLGAVGACAGAAAFGLTVDLAALAAMGLLPRRKRIKRAPT